MIKKFLFSILLGCFTMGFAQEKQSVDSLKTLLNSEKEVSKKTAYYYELGDLYQGSNPDSALLYYDLGREFSRKNNYLEGEAKYARHAISVLNTQGKFQEALELAQEGLLLYKKLNIPTELAIAYINLGKEWRKLSDFERAAENYMMAKKIADSIQDKSTQRITNNNLFALFLDMKEYDKGEPYGFEALKLGREMNDLSKQISPLYNLSMLYYYKKDYPEALKYIEEFEKIILEIGDDYDRVDALLAKGSIIGKMKPEQGIYYLNQAVDEAKNFGFPESEAYGYLYLSDIYLDTKQYQKAIENLKIGIPIAKELGIKYELADFHKKASEAYEKSGDLKNALIHIREHEKLSEEIQIEENKNRMIALETKYRFETKEAEIRSLNAEKEAQTLKIKQKNSLNFGLAGLLLVAGIIGFLAYKNYQNKQKLQAQRIQELEIEKQLFATQALLQGQEDERSRMAKELHDGLGGLLSGVKLNLNNMHKKLIITEEDGAAFEKSIHLLDESISELRRVAHNLMPESILKFGLDGAIGEFLQSIQNEELNIIYQSYHIENGMGKQLDISVYRIIQELVNNAIKHSGATEILVQVRKDEGLLVMDVEDNGKGFDSQSMSKESGMGLAGIKSRVNYWKGKLEIDSGKSGTAVHVEIPVG